MGVTRYVLRMISKYFVPGVTENHDKRSENHDRDAAVPKSIYQLSYCCMDMYMSTV